MNYCFKWATINAGVGYVFLLAGFAPKYTYNLYASGAFLLAALYLAVK